MTTVEQLLESLDESRLRLLEAIEPLPDEALVEKGAAGPWSIADVLVNLALWESELVTGLMRIRQNKRPVGLLDALRDAQGYDQAHYATLQDRDLELVFGDLQQVRVQLEDWLGEFSERELTDPRRYPWFDGRPLREIIAAATFELENSYLEQVEDFAGAWLLEEATHLSRSIPLSTIDLVAPDENDDLAD